MSTPDASATRPRAAVLATLGLVTAAVFAPTCGFPFLWDDNVYVVTNPHLRSLRYVGEYFTATFCAGAAKACAFYRPLVALSYLADYSVWGPSPFGFHLSSVAMHVAVVLVFYALVLRLFARPRAALVAALFFALHPLRVESVAFVAARTDPPAALLALLALWAFVGWQRTGNRMAYVASLLAYAAALLTKEIALTVPALFFLYDGLVARPWTHVRDVVRRLPAYVPYGVVAGLYFVARRAALGYGTTADLRLDDFLRRLATAPALIWDYARLEVVPYPLVIFHGRPTLFGSETVAIAWGIAFLILYLALLAMCRRRAPGVTFGGLWFTIVLLPVLNLVPIPWPTVVERFSYLPSLGFALALGLIMDRAMGAASVPVRRALAGAGVLATCILAALSLSRSRVWSDEILLWQDTAAKAPTFPLAQMNLGIVYQDRGDLAAAAAAYEMALRYNPDNPKIHHNLATLYQDTGRPDDALAEYQKLIALGGAMPQSYFNMGTLYEDRDDAPHAIEAYHEAIRRNPDYLKAHVRLGGLLVDADQPEEALQEFRTAVRIDPYSDVAQLSLARLLDQLGHTKEAVDAYTRYLAIAPQADHDSEEYKDATARLKALR